MVIDVVFFTPKNLVNSPATAPAAASSAGLAINDADALLNAVIKAESSLAKVLTPNKRPPTATVNEVIIAPLTICLAGSWLSSMRTIKSGYIVVVNPVELFIE